MASFFVYRRNSKECEECGFCLEYFSCPGFGKPTIDRFETTCVDCGVCFVACPYQAIERVVDTITRKQNTISVDCEDFVIPERVTVKRALDLLGLEFGKFTSGTEIFAPCETGGCLACAMMIDGQLKAACVTAIRDGMTTSLDLPTDYVPLRRVSGFQPHSVRGVGTPWWVKKSGRYYVEVACFARARKKGKLDRYRYTVFRVGLENSLRTST